MFTIVFRLIGCVDDDIKWFVSKTEINIQCTWPGLAFIRFNCEASSFCLTVPSRVLRSWPEMETEEAFYASVTAPWWQTHLIVWCILFHPNLILPFSSLKFDFHFQYLLSVFTFHICIPTKRTENCIASVQGHDLSPRMETPMPEAAL